MYIPISIEDIDGEEIVSKAIDLDTLRVVQLDSPLNEIPFELPELGSKIRRTQDGTRWMAISSNTLLDAQNERFTHKALQSAIEFSEQHKGLLDELRLEHHPNSRVGVVDSRFMLGDHLVEMGRFDDTPRAEKIISTLEASPGKFKISVGFLYDQKKYRNGIYEDGVRIYERSITDHPANQWTAIGIIDYATKCIKEVGMSGDIRSKLIEMVGEEEADSILQSPDVDQQLKELYGALKFKFEPEGNGDEGKEDDEKVTVPETEKPELQSKTRLRVKAAPKKEEEEEEEEKPKKARHAAPGEKAALSDADAKKLATAIGRIKDPGDRAMMMSMMQDMGLMSESYGEYAKPEEEKKTLPIVVEIEVNGKMVKAQLVDDGNVEEQSVDGAVDKIIEAITSLDEQVKGLKASMKSDIDTAIEDYIGNLPRVVKYRTTQDLETPKPKAVNADPHEERMRVLRSIRPGS